MPFPVRDYIILAIPHVIGAERRGHIHLSNMNNEPRIIFLLRTPSIGSRMLAIADQQ
jgi:hypothetical protein